MAWNADTVTQVISNIIIILLLIIFGLMLFGAFDKE